MMKDRIEMVQKFNDEGKEIISLFLHSGEYGMLFLKDVAFSKTVKEYFVSGRSVSELYCYKYTCNKKLNRIVDRLPADVEQAKKKKNKDRGIQFEIDTVERDSDDERIA